MSAMTRIRWWMLALVFFATTVNYLDRILLGFLLPVIRQEIPITDQQYGYITGAFQAAYTIGFLIAGKYIDWIGSRIGYATALVWWSIAAALHAFSGSAFSLAFWRGVLGIGEAGNFPAAIKSVAEWFPKKDRALATGIFNAGTNVASMMGPPLFVWMNAVYGWRACFLITASLGAVWLAAWLAFYRTPEEHPKANTVELAYIHSDTGPAESGRKLTWLEALGYKQTWGYAIGKFLTDPVWWFYLYWLPPYLYDVRKFNLSQIGWSLPVIYLMADIGSVGGGWISGALIRRGWPSGKARKTALGICAAMMPVAALAVLAESPFVAIALVSLATAAHQGWSANLYTTASDVFPKSATASVTGIGGCLGGLGGFLFSAVIPGYVVQNFGYTPVFLTMGAFHLTALLFLHFLMGDIKPLTEDELRQHN
jgi:ACS family hexuronate transporter-like MFS transporter